MNSKTELRHDVQAIQSLGSVNTIMQVIAEVTGMRFVCVARVTRDSWTACAVLDQLDFGLEPGGELDVATTLCNEVRSGNTPILIDQVGQDEVYCHHHTPATYGFESYFSVPVYRSNGEFFGTLCGLDPAPADVTTPKIRDMLSLFAELISCELESEKRVVDAEAALKHEKEDAELREQFIAVLGHDLRTPLSSIKLSTDLLQLMTEDEKLLPVLQRIEASTHRIENLINNVVDFTRGHLGNGIVLNRAHTSSLGETLHYAVKELENIHSDAAIETDINIEGVLRCDPQRIAQLLSNLLANALVHGDRSQPVRVSAFCHHGLFSLSVSNGGSAIPEQTLARLFQPFWRGEGESGGNGLGLGLYIASEIARSHNGQLDVSSTSEATRFTFSARLAA